MGEGKAKKERGFVWPWVSKCWLSCRGDKFCSFFPWVGKCWLLCYRDDSFFPSFFASPCVRSGLSPEAAFRSPCFAASLLVRVFASGGRGTGRGILRFISVRSTRSSQQSTASQLPSLVAVRRWKGEEAAWCDHAENTVIRWRYHVLVSKSANACDLAPGGGGSAAGSFSHFTSATSSARLDSATKKY